MPDLSVLNLGDGVDRTLRDRLAISTEASQDITDTQKSNARSNLGLGTAATRSVPSSGNANATEVVLGSDSRLTNARPCSDNFVGTTSQWNALSSTDKDQYNTVDLTNDSGGGGGGGGGGTTDYADLDNKPSIENVTLSGNKSASDLGLVKSSALATVATSGSYNDLTNKPTLFSGDYDDLTNKPILFSGDYDDLTNKPTLFSGDYDDLTDKPTIPDGINDLSDVIITSPTNGQVLKYNSNTQKFENDDESGGSTYTAGDGIDITNDVISTDNLQSGDMNEIFSILPTVHAGGEIFISDTLTAGQTTITLTSNYITTSSIIDPYTTVYGVNPITVVVTTGQVVMTFEAQDSDLGVGISIR